MPSDQRRDDHGERYAGKANLDRLIHELEGIVRGIARDGVVTPGEAAALARWRDTEAPTRSRRSRRTPSGSTSSWPTGSGPTR